MDNEENKTSEWNSGEKTQENNASLKGEDEEPKCDLIEHETAGSNHHNKETFSQKNEINGRQINIEDRNNEAKQKVTKENENIELKEVENGDVTGNSDNKFVPETFVCLLFSS